MVVVVLPTPPLSLYKQTVKALWGLSMIFFNREITLITLSFVINSLAVTGITTYHVAEKVGYGLN